MSGQVNNMSTRASTRRKRDGTLGTLPVKGVGLPPFSTLSAGDYDSVRRKHSHEEIVKAAISGRRRVTATILATAVITILYVPFGALGLFTVAASIAIAIVLASVSAVMFGEWLWVRASFRKLEAGHPYREMHREQARRSMYLRSEVPYPGPKEKSQ